MSQYDYREAVCDDIRAELEYRGIRVTAENRDDVYSDLYDDLFVSDSVTGNASGSYTCNAWVAEEYLCHNIDLLVEALEEFGYGSDCTLEIKGAEWCDVTIRCYLLGECLSNVLDEMAEEFEEELEKAEAWWANLDFKTMEKVTSLVQADYSQKDGYQEFVDATDEWWDDLNDEDKVREFQKHC